MSKQKQSSSSFAQTISIRSTQRFKENVKKPAILTLANIRKGCEALKNNRQIYVQFCGEGDKLVEFATAHQMKNTLKELEEYPANTTVYLVHKIKKQIFNAWPVIWQGDVAKKYVIVVYVDPVRYGFKSKAKTFLTIGPPMPIPQAKREHGLWIEGDVRKITFVSMEETISSKMLSGRYGHFWRDVIGDYVKPVESRAKGKPQQYELCRELPDKEQYEKLCRRKFTKTIQEMVDEAYGMVEDLGSELQDIAGNTPDSLQGTGLYAAREQAAERAQDIASSKPKVPKQLRNIKIYRLPQSGTSRSAQADDAAQTLEAISKVVRELPSKNDEFKEFLDQIDNDVVEIEDIEFPGMFG